jgi:hypothetical protein
MSTSLNSVVVRRNYIATSNPFGLQEPPATFLNGLEALDADLVIFPSTHEPLYRLARRCTKTKGIYKLLTNYPDSEVLVAHRLDIWKSVLPTSLDMSWERVLLEIPEFDQWRFKDPDAVADHLDAHEARGSASLDREIADGASQIAGEGYRVLTRKAGSRMHMNEIRGATTRSRPSHGPLKFKGGKGSAVFVGR